MSKVNGFETDLLELVFNNADIAGIGAPSGLQGSVTQGSLYVALFDSTLALESGSAADELTYTGYARVATDRHVTDWDVTGPSVQNVGTIQFAANGGALTPSVVAFAVCKAGAALVDDLIYWGSLTSSKTIPPGTSPRFLDSQLTITED